MKLIPLTQGQFAKVDDKDYEILSQVNWYASFDEKMGSFYAMRHLPTVGGKRPTIKMHRAIMDAKEDEQVDHENHDTLDNRRDNLRLTTHQGNGKNLRLYKRNTSGHCGVTWSKRDRTWRAQIRISGRNVNIGSFRSKAEAIEARAAANMRYGFHDNHGTKIHIPPHHNGNACRDGRNMRRKANNTSGFCGVSWRKDINKWLAKITVNGEVVNLGCYIKKQDAIAARQEANVRYGFHENHGIRLPIEKEDDHANG